MTTWVWLNGKFRTKPWTQAVPEAAQSPPDLRMRSLNLSQNVLRLLGLWDQQSMRHHRWLPESEVLYLFSRWF